jgi:hypothetical protein
MNFSGVTIMLFCLALFGLSSERLFADDVILGAPTPTKVLRRKETLSGPIDGLLYPNLIWKKHSGSARKRLEICRLGPEDHVGTGPLLFEADLAGNWFVAVSSTNVMNLGQKPFWDYNGILSDAGYDKYAPVFEKQRCLVGKNAIGPYGGSEAFVKRVEDNIRLILISSEPGINGDEKPLIGKNGPTTYRIFISSITPLEQVLKEKK